MGMEPRGLPFSRIRNVPRYRATNLIAFAEPAFPADARRRGVEGTVLLDAVIDREGVVLDLSVRDGHPMLALAAMETVRHWRYRPTKVNGIPVEVQTEIEVKFSLPDSVVSS